MVTHATGVFASTFLYALGTSAWIDRGATSVQVMRRMRNSMKSIAKAVPPVRGAEVERHLARLDATVGRPYEDAEDRSDALQDNRQGLGLPDRPEET